jgi:hypothetical protein
MKMMGWIVGRICRQNGKRKMVLASWHLDLFQTAYVKATENILQAQLKFRGERTSTEGFNKETEHKEKSVKKLQCVEPNMSLQFATDDRDNICWQDEKSITGPY